MRKCRQCRSEMPTYTASTTPWQKKRLCGQECAVAWSLAKVRKVSKAKPSPKPKTRQKLTQEAQAAFNSWVRLRDAGKPCVSCGRYHNGQMHAGHYRTTKAAPQLRFNGWNVHSQCSACNNHLSGNLIEYRIELARRIGPEKLACLETRNETRRYSDEYLDRIKRVFRRKVRLVRRLRGIA
jgi:hypothetical protein